MTSSVLYYYVCVNPTCSFVMIRPKYSPFINGRNVLTSRESTGAVCCGREMSRKEVKA